MPALLDKEIAFTWQKPMKRKRADRGGFSDSVNENGIRNWAAQIITAVKYGGDVELCHEIWLCGNDEEKSAVRRMLAKRGIESNG